MLLLAAGQFIVPKKKLSHYALTGLYLCAAIFNVTNINVGSDLVLHYYQLSLIDLPVIFLIGPLMYIILKEIVEADNYKRNHLLYHFITPLVILILSIPYFANSDPLKGYHLKMAMQNSNIIFYNYLFVAGLFLLLAYFSAISLRMIKLFSFRVFKVEPSIQFAWFLLVTGILGILFAFTSMLTRNYFFLRLCMTTVDLAICILFIASHRHTDLLSSAATIARQAGPKKSHLTKIDISRLEKELNHLMTLESLYHDEEISLGRLARRLNISANQLSQFLNEHMEKSFTLFISEYRVAEAKKLLVENPEATVTSIAYRVGFNSISSFNRSFKKLTGETPATFRKGS